MKRRTSGAIEGNREEKPQISPLRCAPVEMTKLLHGIANYPVDARRSMAQQICHLDRSAAEWRDLRFLFPGSHTPSKSIVVFPVCTGSPALPIAMGINVWEFWYLAKEVESREPLPVGRDPGPSHPPNAPRPCWYWVAPVWWSATVPARWESRT